MNNYKCCVVFIENTFSTSFNVKALLSLPLLLTVSKNDCSGTENISPTAKTAARDPHVINGNVKPPYWYRYDPTTGPNHRKLRKIFGLIISMIVLFIPSGRTQKNYFYQ